MILSIVLSGDARLLERLRHDELLPLGSRMRTRLALEYASRDELLACLRHLLATAGNATLMTPELMNTLWDHALGNYRVMTTMAAELLATAAQRESTQLDEKLYLGPKQALGDKLMDREHENQCPLFHSPARSARIRVARCRQRLYTGQW